MPLYLMTLDQKGGESAPEVVRVQCEREDASRALGEWWNRRAPVPGRGWRLRLREVTGQTRDGRDKTGHILEEIG